MKKNKSSAANRGDFAEKAFAALKEAVEGVMITHKRLGLPIYVEKEGKIIAIPPHSIRSAKSFKKSRAAVQSFNI